MKTALLEKKLHKENLHSAESARVALANTPESEAVPALLEIAENEEQKRRALQIVRGLLMTVWLTATLFWLGAFTVYYRRWFNLLTPLQMVVPQFISARTSADARLKQMHNAVIALLRLPYETRCLRPMVDALNLTQTPELKAVLYQELTERLWNLPASDAVFLMDESRRATLRRMLSRPYSIMPNGKREVRPGERFDAATADLMVAIMKTLTGIGDPKLVTVLLKIVKSHSIHPNEHIIRDAAREYLPVLQRKIAEKQSVRRQLWFRAIRGLRDPQEEVAELISTLGRDEGLVALVDYLEHDAIKAKQYTTLSALVLPATGVVIQIVLMISRIPPQFSGDGLGFLPIIVTSVLGVLVFAYSLLFPFHRQAETRRIACEFAKRSGRDPRFLPHLLRAAQSDLDGKQADVVKQAILHLLPQLKTGDAALVPPAGRTVLRSWLKLSNASPAKKRNGTDAAIAALHALGTVGDKKTLPLAERLARSSASNDREVELHRAAVRCVEDLQKRRA